MVLHHQHPLRKNQKKKDVVKSAAVISAAIMSQLSSQPQLLKFHMLMLTQQEEQLNMLPKPLRIELKLEKLKEKLKPESLE